MTETLESPCAICKVDPWGGRTYLIYFGNTVGTISYRVKAGTVITTKYKMAGSRNVFICYNCLLKPEIKRANILLITFVVIGVLTIWTIVAGIIFLLAAVNIYKYGKEVEKALSGDDKEMQARFILKMEKSLDIIGFRLAKKALKSDMKSRGQKYNVFFTPKEYASLQPEQFPI